MRAIFIWVVGFYHQSRLIPPKLGRALYSFLPSTQVREGADVLSGQLWDLYLDTGSICINCPDIFLRPLGGTIANWGFWRFAINAVPDIFCNPTAQVITMLHDTLNQWLQSI